MNYLGPVDAAFLRMESLRTPMHVGCLMTFRLPDDASPDYLRTLLDQMRSDPFMPSPFDCKLSSGRFSGLAPAWVPADIDFDYHIRHSALPYPGGERELGVLVARLHSHPLDFTRPLWECHLIEGLENNRFGFYFKAHHCAIDGMGAMKMVQYWLSKDPMDMSGPGMPTRQQPEQKKTPILGKVKSAAAVARDNTFAIAELGRKLTEMMRSGERSTARASLQTPRSLFNVHTSQQRRLGTQLLSLPRIKAVGKKAGVTVNDVTLAICSGAMRRYLVELDALPANSLTASVPIGLQRDDAATGTAASGFVAPLGTDIADPVRRLQRINSVTSLTKEQMQTMTPAALQQFTLMGLSPLIVGQMTGQLAKWSPIFTTTISNVILNKDKLYLNGAQLEAMYPMSILFDGYALNVTVIGYDNMVAFGFTGCRDAIPSLQRLAVYTSDALEELEKAHGIKAKKAGSSPATGTQTKSTAKAGRKTNTTKAASGKATARKTPSTRKKSG